MRSWWTDLKRGLSREQPEERLLSEQESIGIWQSLRELRPYLRGHWGMMAFGVLIILLLALIALITPLVTRYLIDEVILAGQLHLLLAVGLVLVVIKIAERIGSVYQVYHFNRFENQVLLDIQHKLYDHTLRFPKSFFDGKEIGYLMSRLSSDVMEMRLLFSNTMIYIVSQMLRFIGGVALVLVLEWQLALLVIAPIPFMVLVVAYFSRKTRIISLWGLEERAVVAQGLQESLSAASLIKSFSTEERTVNQLMSRIKASLQVALEGTTVGSLANLAINALPDLVRLAVLLVGAFWTVQGNWTLGSLLAFLSYLGYVYGPVQYLASFNLMLQRALAAFERVRALFAIVPEEKPDTGMAVDHLEGKVSFDNVSFTYGKGEPVLDGLTCEIFPNEKVAIVGPSGVGKTTLLSLILQFYRPTQGQICFDDRPASAYDLRSLRQRIGYVSQSALLLSGTILDNLRYGNPEASMEDVTRACKVANIHDFIQGLSDGYQSLIGERGVNLSEGQKQRLSLARAIIKEPDILILDEPTAALDYATERSIFETLPDLFQGKTIFIVTHRPSTIRRASRILLLNKNRLVATGTHEDLLARNDFYRSIVGWPEFGQQNDCGEG